MMHRCARIRHVSIAALLTTLTVPTMAFGTAANAAKASGTSTAVITGGTATAINECINTAEDTAEANQQNICYQIATAGNVVIVENVNITIYQKGSKHLPVILDEITAALSGGDATAIGECVNAKKHAKAKHSKAKRDKAKHSEKPCAGVQKNATDTLVLGQVNVEVLAG